MRSNRQYSGCAGCGLPHRAVPRWSCITTVVPYHNPIPEKKQTGMGGLVGAWVQAEKMMQIVLLLPSAAFIGWLAGYGLDRWLHQKWISIAGVIFGIVAGLVGAVRMALFYGAGAQGGNGDHNGNGSSDSGGAS
jgi:ATP synthase protein I